MTAVTSVLTSAQGDEGHDRQGTMIARGSRELRTEQGSPGRGTLACPRVRECTLSEVTASSGDKQAKAKICSVQIDEVAVAFSPPA